MPYDKYRNWSTDPGSAPRMMLHSDIKSQVLRDLEELKDETEKLEILDSFEVYAQRCYRREVLEQLSLTILNKLGGPLAGALSTFVTSPSPTSRGRVVKRPTPET